MDLGTCKERGGKRYSRDKTGRTQGPLGVRDEGGKGARMNPVIPMTVTDETDINR